MKIFTKKGIQQKIILVILTVLCINFITPTYSHADFGGILASPFIDFFCSIGDVVINLLQRCMTGEWGSSEAVNMSLSAFLMESTEYYSSDKYKAGDASNATNVNPDKDFDKGWLGIKDEYYVPVATYSPEQIFSGNVSGLDVNFFKDGSASKLQETISSWYIALRNLAIVGLMCVLVYVGIRILLSSTAGDKAKYKQMFTDWLIALCILFFLHYIMSFVLTLTESVVQTIGKGGSYSVSVYDETAEKTFSTNLLGAARFYTQYKDFGQKFTYFIFYIALVAYTGVFTWHYLKRLLMMAFLTIIAPMVALTYPIDKIGDGKAQAFNMWLKEYIYNALIQPFHLIIYTVFVGSAMDLAQSNMLYALACMGFILPAEKILRKMFGFDRAPLGTMGALTGFTFGSLASKFGKGKGGSSAPKGGNAGKEASGENKSPRYERKHGTDGIEYNGNESSTITDGGKAGLPQGNENNTEEENRTEEEKATEAAERAKQAFAEQEKKRQEEERARELANQQREIGEQQRELEQQRIEQNKENDSKDKNDASAKDIKEAGRFRQGVRNVVSAHGGGKRIALKGARTLGRAAKFVAKAGITATGAAAGAAAGLASGKGLTGIVAGATAGKAIGSRMGGAIANAPENIAHTVGKAKTSIVSTVDTFIGNTALQDRVQANAFMKSASTEQYIRDKWTNDHNGQAPSAQQFRQEKQAIQAYANEGMTDISQIYRARKAEKFGVEASQAAKIALLAQDRKIDSSVLGDEKKYEQRKKDFIQEFMDKGLSETQAAEKADYILNVMKAQNGQRHNLEKSTNNTAHIQSSNTTKTQKPRQNTKKLGETNPRGTNAEGTNTEAREPKK